MEEQQLQDYLDGNLKDDELHQFQQKLNSDHTLKEEVDNLRMVEQNLKAIAYDRLRTDVSQWEKNFEKREKGFQSYQYYAIAASLVLFMLAGYYIIIRQSFDAKELYTAYYEPYDDMILARGEESIDEYLRVGMEAYDRHDYLSASESLSRYLLTKPEDAGASLYLGISLMEIDRFEEAVVHMEKALEDKRYQQQAEWYLALLYLKNDQLESARVRLELIRNNEHHYKKADADELFEKISDKVMSK